MGRMLGFDPPGIDLASAQRIAGAQEEAVTNFVNTRTVAGSSDSTFSFGTRASRPASGLQGDRYFATDVLTIYYWTGTAWAYLAGVNAGTDAVRAAITVTAIDNGMLFFTTDAGKLWRVEAGAWVDKFVTLTLTTSLKIGANKVIGARGAALTAADAGAINSGDATTDAVIANMRTRINELEARLGSATGHGLFT